MNRFDRLPQPFPATRMCAAWMWAFYSLPRLRLLLPSNMIHGTAEIISLVFSRLGAANAVAAARAGRRRECELPGPGSPFSGQPTGLRPTPDSRTPVRPLYQARRSFLSLPQPSPAFPKPPPPLGRGRTFPGKAPDLPRPYLGVLPYFPECGSSHAFLRQSFEPTSRPHRLGVEVTCGPPS